METDILNPTKHIKRMWQNRVTVSSKTQPLARSFASIIVHRAVRDTYSLLPPQEL